MKMLQFRLKFENMLLNFEEMFKIFKIFKIS